MTPEQRLAEQSAATEFVARHGGGAVDLPAIMELVADVDGWMSPGQAATLFDAARRCPPAGTIVEIGSFRGRSTIVLARAAPPAARLVAIDPHAGTGLSSGDHAAFVANLERAGVTDRVEHLRMFSDEALAHVEGDVDVLYIDGAHTYEPALADIRSWGDRVADGGTMLIHDSFASLGVTRAVLRALPFGSKFRYVGRSRSMTIYRADLAPGRGARLVNGSRQIAQIPWFVWNMTLKVMLSLGYGSLMMRFGRSAPEWPY